MARAIMVCVVYFWKLVKTCVVHVMCMVPLVMVNVVLVVMVVIVMLVMVVMVVVVMLMVVMVMRNGDDSSVHDAGDDADAGDRGVMVVMLPSGVRMCKLSSDTYFYSLV